MTAIRDRKSSGPVWIGLLFAFAYGALHTMGPGHGKAVVISYFVGHGGSLGRGIRMGSLIAVCHVLSAVIVIGLTSFAMHRITGHPPADFRIVRLISYAAIVGIGAFMLWRALCDMRSDKLSHGDHPDSTVLPRKDTPMGWLALAAGAVPCTGAILVLLFGLSHNLLIPAVLMVMMISLGMAMAMSGIGILAIWGRNYAERRFIKNGAARRRFNTSIKLGSASLILMIGLTLFTLTMGEKTPFQNAVARAGVSTVQN
nr:hypothetical protein [uncultured Desulfobacter sp.]